MLDYSHTFGLRTAVLRMSCIYGPRQLGTEDQGWVAHFLISALQGRPLSIFGDGAQVRDILDVADAVEAYVRALERIGRISGHAFNLGGGPANAVSLLQLIGRIEGLLNRQIPVSHADWRPGDQRYFVADRRRIDAALDLPHRSRGTRASLACSPGWRGRAAPRSAVSAALPRRRPCDEGRARQPALEL